jgi:hypothetical protein
MRQVRDAEGDGEMNREETKERLEEALELVFTHMGHVNYSEADIIEKLYVNSPNKWILTFSVDYEDDAE